MQNVVLAWTLSILFLFVGCDNWITNPDSNDNSPDEILFIRQDGAVSEICAVEPDGSHLRTLVSHDGAGQMTREGFINAVWSPDKSRIAVVGGPNESLDLFPIWIMDTTGVFMTRVTQAGRLPIWASNTQLYYSQPTGYFSQAYDIYRYDTVTKEHTLVYSPFPLDSIRGMNFGGRDMLSEEIMLGGFVEYTIDTNGKMHVENRGIGTLNMQTKTISKLKTQPPEIKLYIISGVSPDNSKVLYRASYDTSTIWAPRNLFYFDISAPEDAHQITHFSGFNIYMNLSFVWGPDNRHVAFSNPHPMTTGKLGWDPYWDVFTVDIYTGTIDTVTFWAQDSIASLVTDWR